MRESGDGATSSPACERWLAGRTWPIELALTDRDEMGFRMLLGRAAIRRRFLVDPGRSYLGDVSALPRSATGDASPDDR